MSEHGCGRCAHLLKQGEERQTQARHRRLADLGRSQSRLGRGEGLRIRRAVAQGQVGIEKRAQRPAQLRMQLGTERVVERIEPRTENRDGLVRLAQEPHPLRALSGKEQNKPARVRFERPLREDDARPQRLWRRDLGDCEFAPLRLRGVACGQRSASGREAFCQLGEGGRDHREPRISLLALAEREAEVDESGSLALDRGQRRQQLARRLRRHRRTHAAEEKQLGPRLRRWAHKRLSGPDPLRPALCPRRLLEHQVRVGAAKAERTDRRAARLPIALLPGKRRARQKEWTLRGSLLREPEARILLFGRGLRRQRAVVQSQRRLEQSGDARRRHGVADVRLHRPERGLRALGRNPAILDELVAQRRDLDQVADGRGGAVRFDVANAGRGHGCVAVRKPQRLELSALARRHWTFAASIVVAAGAADERVDAVAVALRVLEPLEDHCPHALAHDEAVGARVERPALARPRDGADAREADQVVGEQVQVNAACDREIDLAGAQIDDGLLGRHQG